MSSSSVTSRHDGARYLYMLAAFVVIVAGIRAAEPILNPLLLAVFLSVICAPAYLGLLRRGVSQWLSLLIVAAALSAVAIVLMAVVMRSITEFNDRQDEYREKIVTRRATIEKEIQSWFGRKNAVDPREATVLRLDSENINDRHEIDAAVGTADAGTSEDSSVAVIAGHKPHDLETRTKFPEPAGENSSPEVSKKDRSFTTLLYEQFDPATVLSFATQLLGSLGNLLSQVMLIMLMVIFILLEAGTFEQKLKRAFSRRQQTTQQAAQIVQNVQRYMAIKTGMSLLTAVLIGMWLKMFRVEFISLWILLAFLLNFIPNVGSIAAAIPAVLIVWLDSALISAIGCAVGYIIVNLVIGNLLEPRLMGKGLGLSPLVIFCSMMFWGWALGPVGMLLSVPLTMTVHIVLNGFDDTRWIATLMGGSVSTQS